jgi:hypothetical protein
VDHAAVAVRAQDGEVVRARCRILAVEQLTVETLLGEETAGGLVPVCL